MDAATAETVSVSVVGPPEAPVLVKKTIQIISESKGLAAIKTEYVLKDYVREVDIQFLSAADREKLGVSETNPEAAGDQASSTNGAPKLKGRNKKRAKAGYRDAIKICSYVMQNKPCPYGEKCRYAHDATIYLSSKPPDIGDKCINLEKRGSCQYGMTCRFASKDHVPVEQPIQSSEGEVEKTFHPDETNGISREVQRILRKRTFVFQKGDRNREAQAKQSKKELDEPADAVEEELEPLVDLVLNDEPISGAEEKRLGSVTNEGQISLRLSEKKKLDFRDKLYLSPLTTVGNLPFRRICKRLGADITVGEMALARNLLAGQQSEWALMVRHSSEDIFGVQVAGSKPDEMKKLAYLLRSEVSVDFVDINSGCPIDLVCNSGSGCALMGRLPRMQGVVQNMVEVLDVPLTLKMRTGLHDGKNIAHELIPKLREWGVSSVSLHGRSREQRYTKLADWDYIAHCADIADPMPLFGNGDVMNFEDYYHYKENSQIAGALLARGALIKPWLFTEIKEKRHWDISAQERLDIFREYTNNGLDHWGTDTRGVESTRRFLLEWMSFTNRYIPLGILERPIHRINERPPYYCGRSDLETLLSSAHCRDWIKITEMLLGPVPEGFTFLPKHKANAWK